MPKHFGLFGFSDGFYARMDSGRRKEMKPKGITCKVLFNDAWGTDGKIQKAECITHHQHLFYVYRVRHHGGYGGQGILVCQVGEDEWLAQKKLGKARRKKK